MKNKPSINSKAKKKKTKIVKEAIEVQLAHELTITVLIVYHIKFGLSYMLTGIKGQRKGQYSQRYHHHQKAEKQLVLCDRKINDFNLFYRDIIKQLAVRP